MMAISRFRFALLLTLFLALSASLAPEASAYDPLVVTEQIVPDDEGETPASSQGGGSSSVPSNRMSKVASLKGSSRAAASKSESQRISLLILFLQRLWGVDLTQMSDQ